MHSVLAVDLGKTSCRAALFGAAHVLAEASGNGAPGLADPDGVTRAESAVLEVVARLVRGTDHEHADHEHAHHEQAHHEIESDTVVVGAAGASAAPVGARELAARLARRLIGVEVVVASDAATAHAGALNAEPGVVLAAGTGSVALAVGADGTSFQVDGWGYWLGDEGSGAWIGRAGLAAALRAHDGRGPATALTSVATREFGADLTVLPARIAAGAELGRRSAAFAPCVADAARQGDAVAMEIVDTAGEALARTVLAAVDRLVGLSPSPPPVPVALTGGLLQLGSILLDTLRARLDVAHIDLREPVGDALAGGRLLARCRDTPHEAGLVRLPARAGS